MVVALTGNSFVSKSGMYLNEEIYQRLVGLTISLFCFNLVIKI